MYCPSADACGNTDLEFENTKKGKFKNITSEIADLCIYSFTSKVDGVVSIDSPTKLTMIDTDTFKQRCLTRPCNITAKLERGNELLVIANDTRVPV